MMSCNTGFHDRCGGCTCTCHPVTQAPVPASRHVALQDANERASDAIAEYARTELGKRLTAWLS